MSENNSIEYLKKYIENLKTEIIKKQDDLNKLISILNNEIDFES